MTNLEERFWRGVQTGNDDECWEWKRGTTQKGYGVISNGVGVGLRTHRVSFQFAYGEIPDGLNVLHRCDNPPCCNPRHLFLGTQKDNIQDALSKGRIKMETHCKHGHEFTPENSYVRPLKGRDCKECRRLRNAARKYVS